MKRGDALTEEVLQQRARSLQQAQGTLDIVTSLDQNAHLLVRCASERLAIELKWVVEVLANLSLTRIPCTPDSIAGVVNIRGEIVDVIDLAAFLGQRAAQLRDDAQTLAWVAVCEVDGQRFGLAVQSVNTIVTIDPRAVVEMPETLFAGHREYVTGIIRLGARDDEIASILRVDAVLRSRRFEALSAHLRAAEV